MSTLADELRIPTFASTCRSAAGTAQLPFIELKADIVGEALCLVRRMGLEEYCVVSSGRLEHLEEARALSDKVFIHHIFSSEDNIPRLVELGYAGMSFKIADLDDVPGGLVEKVHDAGLRVCFRAPIPLKLCGALLTWASIMSRRIACTLLGPL